MCVTPNSTTGWEESAPPCDQAARGKTRVSRGATSPSDHSERASRSASVSAPGRDGTTRDEEGSAKRRARRAERGREPSFVSNQTGKRIGQNEALFREVNERIGGLQGSLGIAGALDIVCECGTADCTERFSISRDDYVALRDNPRRFVVVPGHEASEVEVAVAVVVGDGYLVVEKTDPDAVEVAEETAEENA